MKSKHFTKRLLVLLALPALTMPMGPVMPNMPPSPDIQSVLNRTPSQNYIVMLKEGGGAADESLSAALAKKFDFQIEQTFSKAIKGFSANLSASALQNLAHDANIEAIVEDRPVEAFAQTLPTGIDRVDAESNVGNNTGAGIGVAVIDTGIDLNHTDLKTNIVASKSCVFPYRTGHDDNGHGTHVAGIVAAKNNSTGVVGVAPEAKLIAVKVLDRYGRGSWSSIICGLDWVAANASRYNIKVANLSLGGSGISDNNCGYTNKDPLHRAICRLRDAGVTVVVAAGNSNTSTNNVVPASYDDAVITVSALADSDGKPYGNGQGFNFGADDTFATFSNFGPSVDLGAPGVNIYSTYRSGSYAYMSGTSMAAPHVAGAAARFIKSNPTSSWTQVRDGLINTGEALGTGHTDPSGKHPEPVIKAN